MKRILFVATCMIALASLTFGQKTDLAKEEASLKQLVQELTEAVAQGDTDKLARLQADEFKGTGGGLNLSKQALHNALRSGDAKVSS